MIWNAITFIYEGQKDFGLELLRKNLELSYLVGDTRGTAHCCSAFGDTGEVNYGWDYWFNWSIWTAPAALLNQTLLPCRGPAAWCTVSSPREKTALDRTYCQYFAPGRSLPSNTRHRS